MITIPDEVFLNQPQICVPKQQLNNLNPILKPLNSNIHLNAQSSFFSNQSQNQNRNRIENSDLYENDSNVSLQQNILKEHFIIFKFKVKQVMKFLFKNLNCIEIMNLISSKQVIQSNSLMECLLENQDQLMGREIQFYSRIFNKQYNTFKFLAQILQQTPQLLVHQILFMALRCLELPFNFQYMNYSLIEIRELACSDRVLKHICDHQHLKIMRYQFIAQQIDISKKNQVKLRQFVIFFISTLIMVRACYFINPYYEKMMRNKRFKILRKKKKIVKQKKQLMIYH